ncbi:SCO2583 family membrane protein [Streptomyces anulatus]|uniref:SCO2583 family membrane protein n=1 Tax=Streptomyces anulatus TaxID=1892 RepID=UPI0033199442
MTGRSEPPDGAPENPAGGEDEYRSLVFDESFVQAARMQEYSAQERMGEPARAVRALPDAETSVRSGGGSRAAIALVVLIALAFAVAVYIGFRSPYPQPATRRAEPLRTTVVPLAPRGVVPGGSPEQLYRAEPVAGFRTGAAGINYPAVERTQNFSDSQITAALATVKDYLVESSLNPDVLTGSVRRPVEHLLDPDQRPQFERSLSDPADDGSRAATGWLVRFDPEQVELADPRIRVQGTLRYEEEAPGVLDVLSDHTFTYALRPADGPHRDDDASLFTVRRELHFRFDREDLRLHRLEMRTAHVQAGPQSCSADATGMLRPLLAGERADARGPAATDPYATGRPTAALCGALEAVSSPTTSPGSPPQGPAADRTSRPRS